MTIDSRLRAALLAAALLGAGGSARVDTLTGSSHELQRTYAGEGSQRSVGTTYALTWAVGEPVGAAASGNSYSLIPGIEAISDYPGTIVTLAAQTGDAAGQVILQWLTP